MAGPDDLDQAAFDLLNQLETVGSGFGSTQEVQVLALIDYDRANWSRTSRAQVDGVNDGDAAVYCVRKDLLTETSNRSVVLPAGRIFNRADNEVDMSAPATLAGFIDWGLAHFPAARSALVLWGDPQGYGWKADPARALGPGQDTRKSGAADFDADAGAFTIAELADTIAAGLPRTTDPAPAAIPLDLLVLDMGQMANLDVAYQFLDVANNLVAWETPVDRTTAAYADLYRGLLNGLRCGSDGVKWTCDGVRNATGAAVATQFVSQYPPTPGQTLVALALNNTTGAGTRHAHQAGRVRVRLGGQPHARHGRPGRPGHAGRQCPSPVGAAVRAQAATMADRTFIDLLDFARRLTGIAALDAISTPADAIVAALSTPGNGPVREARSSGNADLGGISLFFPATQRRSGDVQRRRHERLRLGQSAAVASALRRRRRHRRGHGGGRGGHGGQRGRGRRGAAGLRAAETMGRIPATLLRARGRGLCPRRGRHVRPFAGPAHGRDGHAGRRRVQRQRRRDAALLLGPGPGPRQCRAVAGLRQQHARWTNRAPRTATATAWTGSTMTPMPRASPPRGRARKRARPSSSACWSTTTTIWRTPICSGAAASLECGHGPGDALLCGGAPVPRRRRSPAQRGACGLPVGHRRQPGHGGHGGGPARESAAAGFGPVPQQHRGRGGQRRLHHGHPHAGVDRSPAPG
ncbi:MAG: clostripain-related cysteine peptidase [Caldilineaceae bacterium]